MFMKNLGLLFFFSMLLLFLSCGKSDEALAPTLSSAFSADESFSSSASSSSSSSNSTSGGNATAEGVVDQPGVITAGEWNDVANWEFWQNLLNDKDYSDKSTYWDMNTTNGISVLVTDNANQPVIDAKVALMHKGINLWIAKTDNKGQAVVFPSLFEPIEGLKFADLALSINNGEQTVTAPKSLTQGTNEITLNRMVQPIDKVDISFVVDATSSMADELEFLKTELKDVIRRAGKDNPAIPISTATVFYRDEGDEYVTRKSEFSTEIFQTLDFINQQEAQGGGNYPEAVHSALTEALAELEWSNSARSRIMFLVLDAPPHHEEQVIAEVQAALKKAAEIGIKIIPITASGIDKETEFLMRFSAIATNGTYVFITDHSGIGNDHLEPTIGDYEVEFLNDLMVRLINENLE